MIFRASSRRAVAAPAAVLVLALAVVSAGCADDGNDTGLQLRQAAERAAEFRASSTTVAPVDEPADSVADDADDADEAVSATTEPAVEPTGVVVPVYALDNSFRPDRIEIEVGDEVLWENRGLNEHNVLTVEGDDWGVEVEGFQPGAVYTHLFTEPGEYRYYCSIHGSTEVGMVGTVVVTG